LLPWLFSQSEMEVETAPNLPSCPTWVFRLFKWW
jgi:hypothetical protein